MINPKKIIPVLFLIILVFLTSCTKYETIFIDTGGEEEIKIKAELADTQEKKERGLMFRESLKENSGMFFPFDEDATYNFWMKNTLIPLDIIFISKDFKIVEIIHAEPCEEEPCKSYKTSQYSRYVLEVNGGFTTRNNIVVGNKIAIK